VIATNQKVTKEMALAVSEIFTEVIVAPDFDQDALDVLTEKANIRILKVVAPAVGIHAEMRPISGGMLLQSQDRFQSPGDEVGNWQLVSGPPADAKTLADLEFAWRASRCVKSNGILLAKDLAAVGIGMGQVNRVDSARLAVSRAGSDRAKNSVAASDAFFPFADGLEVLLNAGISAVVQPGGSVRDEEVIAAANCRHHYVLHRHQAFLPLSKSICLHPTAGQQTVAGWASYENLCKTAMANPECLFRNSGFTICCCLPRFSIWCHPSFAKCFTCIYFEIAVTRFSRGIVKSPKAQSRSNCAGNTRNISSNFGDCCAAGK
jgi:hypothetical protein